jgi:FKBP-type peptidyl-prolyl cis-trans isomerase
MNDYRSYNSEETRAKKAAAGRASRNHQKAKDERTALAKRIAEVVRNAKRAQKSVAKRDKVYYFGRLATGAALGCRRLG